MRSTLPKTSEWKAPESDKVPKEKDQGFWAMIFCRFLGICDFVFKDGADVRFARGVFHI